MIAEHAQSEVNALVLADRRVLRRVQVRLDQMEENVRIFAGVVDLGAVGFSHRQIAESVGDDR